MGEIGIEVSESHKEKGKRFYQLLLEEVICKSILPNHEKDFSYELRKRDLGRYKEFIFSSSYDDVVQQDGAGYVGE